LNLIRAFINGRIYISFKPLRITDGMVVSNNRVLYVGSSNRALELVKTLGGEVVDLKNRVVLPGFIDSHLHIDTLGLAISTLDLRGVKSIAEIKEKLREYASKTRFKWILGHGWDHELLEEKRWPTRRDLDEVVEDRPVLLTRVCLHAGVVNTKGLIESGIIDKQVEGIDRDENGEPTGVLFENALRYVREKIKNDLSEEDYLHLVKTAQEHLLQHGVTSIGVAGCNLRVLKAIVKLWSLGELKIRVRLYLYHRDGEENTLDLLKNLGVKSGFGDEYLKIMGIKLFADGSLGSRTAWLSEPYSDDPSNSGGPALDPEELTRIVVDASRHGLQVAVHAIGDRALDTVLQAFREAGSSRVKHRIEHASLIRDDQLEVLRELKPMISVQPHFIITDWWAKNRLGEKRVKWLYRFKTLIENGLTIGFQQTPLLNP